MKRSDELDPLTWDQAAMLQLATLPAMRALGYNDSTLRNWAAAGHIHPVAKAPGGQFLYHRPTIAAAERWLKTRRHDEAS